MHRFKTIHLKYWINKPGVFNKNVYFLLLLYSKIAMERYIERLKRYAYITKLVHFHNRHGTQWPVRSGNNHVTLDLNKCNSQQRRRKIKKKQLFIVRFMIMIILARMVIGEKKTIKVTFMNENYLVIKAISRFHYLQISRPRFVRRALKNMKL